MEPLIKVLKLVDQDKKPTLSIIYETMDEVKLTIKTSMKNWEVIDKMWSNQLHRHLHVVGNKKNLIYFLLFIQMQSIIN